MISHQLRLLVVAVQFLTRLPVPALNHYDPKWLQQSARYFPLVGLMIGCLTAGVFWLLTWAFNPWVAAVGSSAFSIRLTGAFHEDGLADTCDGLGGGLDAQQALEIMKDSRLGTYGTLGLVLTLGLKVVLLASLPLSWALVALVLAHGWSRFFSLLLIYFLNYAGNLEAAKAKPLAQQITLAEVLLAGFYLLPTLALFFVPGFTGATSTLLLCLGMMLVVAWYLARLLKKRLGGYTGDGLGATQQLTEVACYLGVAALWL